MADSDTRSHTVLVVDDDEAIRETLADVLTEEGYSVLTAANGQEALAILKRGPPHPCVVLADLMMPVMNGWELRVYQQSDPELEIIPMVAVSAVADPNQEPKFTAYLRKPIDLNLLLQIMEQHCHRHRRAPAPPSASP